MKANIRAYALGLLGILVASGIVVAQNPQRIEHETEHKATPQPTQVLKWKVAIGRFSNETQYGKGIFYERENDPMAKQALDILSTKLSSSGKFILLERGDLDKIEAELKTQASTTQKIGADYLILGSITEFGRKTTGKEGLFTTEKSQIVEAGVSIRIVDVATGLIIYSEEGKGSAETTSKSTLGFGGKAGYDATLSDKAISGAIDMLVENIINKCTDKPWRTYLLSVDDEGVIIAGGVSQGLRQGDIFGVFARGKKVKNPQTGVEFELPGKQIATIKVEATMGETTETEFSIVTVVDGQIDPTQYEHYYIQQL
ncbi:CsgG/HfaB family protein [Porphyromonas sp. COT-290 OH860]|uniref:CsgG/HfaB family protein n=1 Tax=Porphyromonas sp. COT-290 OH860 TaxID=1515615 RepID=UPI0005C48C2F|nr:CsgG/HfaB family protein [Porphyromonas sp. COT-290 OH860]